VFGTVREAMLPPGPLLRESDFDLDVNPCGLFSEARDSNRTHLPGVDTALPSRNVLFFVFRP
jgi:hypothetical protein